MSIRLRTLVPVLLSQLLVSDLCAVELGEHFRLNGFATVGASTVLEPGQEFRAYTFQKDGVRKGEVNLPNNTLFGLQGDVLFNRRFSATVQGVAYNTRENDYDVVADWAYFSYLTGIGLTLRAGKFRLPLFNSSELTYVGYARSWVRPALPFYGIAGFEHYTGADLIYRFDTDALSLGFEFGAGRGKESSTPPDGGERRFDSNDLFIAKATVDGSFFHAGITYFHATTRMRASNGASGRNIDITTLTQMVSTEAELHFGDASVDAGFGYGWTQNTMPDEMLAYVGGAYQMDAWRPYALYASKTFDHKPADRSDPPPGAPPLRSEPGYVAEHTFSLGLRYDFMDNADIKFQADRILGMEYLPQLLISDDSDDREATVFTLAVDMVF